MPNEASIIFPQIVPVAGFANHVPQPVAPVAVPANRTPQTTTAPATALRTKAVATPTTQSTALRAVNPDPYNTNVPLIGSVTHAPILVGIDGVSPAQETPTENWSWVYGNGGGY
jgi:hypothetical protein